MSRFFSERFSDLEAYVPGEQPKDQQYIKLNTNENAFPPHPAVAEAAEREARMLHLYPDPECAELRKTLAERIGLTPEELVIVNGSDEVLNFAFMAFCDSHIPAVFPDITYGFYPVFARLNQVEFREIPLQEDLTIRPEDYYHAAGTIFLANPNAPTGIALPLSDIETIIKSNPDSIVVMDEAYVDFGAERAVGLIDTYDNLLVTQTFSKSRSLAGGRLGMAIGNASLIQDLNTVKFSTNPYNVNSMTQAAGLGALMDDEYFKHNCAEIIKNRSYLIDELSILGFTATDSSTNFIFAKHPAIGGEELYLKLKDRGVLIRHFTIDRIRDFNRITVGTREQIDILLDNIRDILGGTYENR